MIMKNEVKEKGQGAGLGERIARFYSCNAAVAIAFCHSRDIACRGLTAESFWLAENGYLKLVDLTSAIQLREGEQSKSVLPISNYVAPEILARTGHDKRVDWFSLGCITYEMVVGKPPYRGEDDMETYHNILIGDTKYPWWLTCTSCKSALSGMLELNPEKRLGAREKDEVMRHSWFKTIAFESIESKLMHPPLLPSLRTAIDTINFEALPSVSVDDEEDWRDGVPDKEITKASAFFNEFDEKLPEQMDDQKIDILGEAKEAAAGRRKTISGAHSY